MRWYHCPSRFVTVFFGTLFSSIKKIKVPYVFDGEHGIAQHAMQGNRASGQDNNFPFCGCCPGSHWPFLKVPLLSLLPLFLCPGLTPSLQREPPWPPRKTHSFSLELWTASSVWESALPPSPWGSFPSYTEDSNRILFSQTRVNHLSKEARRILLYPLTLSYFSPWYSLICKNILYTYHLFFVHLLPLQYHPQNKTLPVPFTVYSVSLHWQRSKVKGKGSYTDYQRNYTLKKYFIYIYLIYNLLLVSGVQQSD